MDLKVLICDDEFGMRTVLRKAVEKIDGFKIVGEAEDGEDVIELVEETRPNIVFLDIEMPKQSGVECAKKIADIDPKIIIIFATGYNEYMSEAFELYAFDYIVKPFKLERIYQTLQKIKDINKLKEEQSINKIIRHEKGLDKILIKNKEGLSFVDIKDIIMIQREDRSTVIYTIDNNYVTSEALSSLEEKLDKTQFFRSHKSYIINLSMIQKIYPYGRWTYIAKLRNTDKDALLTHEKYEEMKNIFL
ncbi:LytR/AlgR family response regulator transcription factor [Clostridium brassicae]|uniref:Stage 0 sporulation protein A homolog n=1 Tax=Clostridium brassicae TaxID=2999072 RepID=A0ABT4D4P0_9CLOT|nr:LytTR family DNA-binding domain-containing protein [Clostridium brassicae]MCY6957247.1 LytTR family DNA-binding domain-containing protein [Clostridium brassicae]